MPLAAPSVDGAPKRGPVSRRRIAAHRLLRGYYCDGGRQALGRRAFVPLCRAFSRRGRARRRGPGRVTSRLIQQRAPAERMRQRARASFNGDGARYPRPGYGGSPRNPLSSRPTRSTRAAFFFLSRERRIITRESVPRDSTCRRRGARRDFVGNVFVLALVRAGTRDAEGAGPGAAVMNDGASGRRAISRRLSSPCARLINYYECPASVSLDTRARLPPRCPVAFVSRRSGF